MLVCVLPQLSVVGYFLILVFEAGKVVMGLVLSPQHASSNMNTQYLLFTNMHPVCSAK